MSYKMTDNKFVVQFYNPKAEFGYLSNYYDLNENKMKLVLNNLNWKSTEHFYQAMKFTDAKYQETVRKARTPNMARVLASQKVDNHTTWKWKQNLTSCIQESLANGVKIRPDWEEIKDDIMYTCVYEKFKQNEYLGDLLVNTRDCLIQENSPRDSYWGIGKDRKGLNRLGIILMKVRKVLQIETNFKLD